jgi:hypothetical protein
VVVDGTGVPSNTQPSVEYDEVNPGYFGTIGIPIVAGREFTHADDQNAPHPAVRVHQEPTGLTPVKKWELQAIEMQSPQGG